MRLKSHIVVLCLLVGPAVLHGADWVERATVAHPQGDLWLPTAWNPERGLHIRFSSGENAGTNVVLELTSHRATLTFTPERSFPAAIRHNIQSSPVALPVTTKATADVLLKFRPEGWAVYVEQRPVLFFACPFDVPFAVAQPADEVATDGEEEVFFQRTGTFQFADDFMVPQDEENALGHWQVHGGEWRLHTVVDNSTERHLLSQDRKKLKPTAARSPNFYSLEASGTNALITTGHEFYDLYDVSASTHVQDGEMGIVFHHQEGKGCFGFTLKMSTNDVQRAELALWRAPLDSLNERLTLATAHTRITHGQWVNMKVRIFLNRVQCYIDGTRAFDVPVELPTGGRPGLFANSDSPVLFDDVRARTNHDLDIRTLADLERHTLRETGRFLSTERESALFPVDRQPLMVRPDRSHRPQELVIGSAQHPAHVFAATFSPRSLPYEVGLIAGYRGNRSTYYRFRYRRSSEGGWFSLESLSPDGVTKLESRYMPQPPSARSAPFELMCDASDDHTLRLYLDRKLVLFHCSPGELTGASGLYVGPGTDVGISALIYAAQRDDTYRNLFEKNRQFVTDPFMRHWSSPEGQWITLKDKTTWYKGDFFGRFDIRLPLLANSEVHLGVREGQTNGRIVAHISSTNLSLYTAGPTAAPRSGAVSIPYDDLPVLDKGAPEFATSPRWYTLHYEDYWFWVTSGTNVVAKVPLARPLSGTRVRLAGFTSKQLTYSKVYRYNVKDCLFTESLHEWTLNGGRWEVINRFNCLTEWSHMNGESKEGLAALWSKYRFEGDFCLEFYAGIRHGWYDRLGDLNITVMNDRTTPSEGYTVTCTGWDPDHSQLHTRLYRDGEILAETEDYLVPRLREGNVRHGYNPLVAPGRDAHGAWYYIKLRRINGRLQYLFDNELVFDVEDTRPLNSGSFGVWTFMNSMMVARVKMAAEKISRTPVPIERQSAEADHVDPEAAATYTPAPVDALRAAPSGAPLVPTSPDFWHVNDDVGHSRLSWHQGGEGSPYFVVSNVLGSGAMHAASDLPVAALPDIAGWSFEVKRTPGAMFNFHYTVGRNLSDGELKEGEHLFHQLSGSGFTEGSHRLVDATRVPPVAPGPGWHQTGKWTRVTVWLDASHVSGEHKTALVKVDGFGNLQPSFVPQGLKGNGPGEGYAVRNFAEIRYGRPVFQAEENDVAGDIVLAARDRTTDRVLCMVDGLPSLAERLAADRQDGLHDIMIEAHRGQTTRRFPLSWVELPEHRSLTLNWSPVERDTLVMSAHTPYRDPRLAPTSVSVNGVAATIEPASQNRYAIPLPRTPALQTGKIAVDIKAGESHLEETIEAAGQRAGGPVLLELAGLSPMCATFERRTPPAGFSLSKPQRSLVRGDSRRGTYLDVANAGREARLLSSITLPRAASLAEFPLLQFSYRATEMAAVSLAIDRGSMVSLGEKIPEAVTIRDAGHLVRDGKWHTWYGMISDGVDLSNSPMEAIETRLLTIGSHHKVDQTGLHSHLHLDDVMLGPAVSPRKPLRVTPVYYDLDGVAEVRWAMRRGTNTLTDPTAGDTQGLDWTAVAPGEEIVPDLAAVAEGMGQLLIKAIDIHGAESLVTAVPLLVDRTPLHANMYFKKVDTPLCNESMLYVQFPEEGGALLDMAKLVLSLNGKPYPIKAPGAAYARARGESKLELNWPLLLGSGLNASKDGQTNTIVLSGITDGAGNVSDDLTAETVVDYASDNTPPTLFSATFPSNVLWVASAAIPGNMQHVLLPVEESVIEAMHEQGAEPYFRLTPGSDKGGWTCTFGRSIAWDVTQYPYLSMRVRRPEYTEDPEFRVELAFAVTKLGNRPLSLTRQRKEKGQQKGDKRFTLPEPIEWTSNSWHSITIDMRDVLKQEVEKDLASYKITAVGATVTQTKTRRPVDFQSIFISAPWGTDTSVAMSAFDASGIAGATQDRRGGTYTLTPLQVLKDEPNDGWMGLVVRDKAGNASAPLRVPVVRSESPLGQVE